MNVILHNLQICSLVFILIEYTYFRSTNGVYLKNYTGDKVLRVNLADEDLPRFEEVCSSFPYQAERWGTSDLFVPKQHFNTVISELNKNGLSYEVSVPDMEKLFEEVNEMNRKNRLHHRPKRNVIRNDVIGIYATHEQIQDWVEELGFSVPNLVKVTSIGTSHEGRNITLLKIGIDTGREKPAIWVDAGVHAREWVSPASVIYIIYSLITGYYADDKKTVTLLEEVDWYIVPLVNPDGYVYSHNQDRLWRKNLRPDLNNTGCLGVDLNRNFDFQWGGASSSKYQCAENFKGPYPASEPETQAISQAVMERRHQILAFVTVHAYAQLWLVRWSYTNVSIEDHDQQMLLGTKATDAIRESTGYNYTAAPPYKVLYPYAGGSSDWARAIAGIKYSYCVELRDQGKFHFLLPEEQIIPTGKELFAALKVVVKEIVITDQPEKPSGTTTRRDTKTSTFNDASAELLGQRSIGPLMFLILFTKLLQNLL